MRVRSYFKQLLDRTAFFHQPIEGFSFLKEKAICQHLLIVLIECVKRAPFRHKNQTLSDGNRIVDLFSGQVLRRKKCILVDGYGFLNAASVERSREMSGLFKANKIVKVSRKPGDSSQSRPARNTHGRPSPFPRRCAGFP
jgi:hypothetical protein